MQFATKKRKKKGGGGNGESGLATLSLAADVEQVQELQHQIEQMIGKAETLEDVLERAVRAKQPRRGCVCG